MVIISAWLIFVCVFTWSCVESSNKGATFQDRTLSMPHCSTQYNKVGCFRENKDKRVMPSLLFSDLGVYKKIKPSGHIFDFTMWNSTLQSLACRCAEQAQALGFRYFALQSLGECWSSKEADESKFYLPGPSSNCVGADFNSCGDNPDSECVGQRLTNYIYKLPEMKPNRIINTRIPQTSQPTSSLNKLKDLNARNKTMKSACNQKLDLVFVIDGSGSIEESGTGNFRKCLQFVKSVIKAYSVSEENTHVGIIVYATKPKLVLDLNKNNNIKDINATIDTIDYPSTGTNTGKALKLAKTELFQKSLRPGTPRMLLLMTDGKSYDDVIAPALELKALGVTMFTLGLGDGLDVDQLSQVASDPVSTHIMKADFSELKDLGEAMGAIRRTCEVNVNTVKPDVQEQGQRRSRPLFNSQTIRKFTIKAKRARRGKLNGVIRKVWKNIEQDGLPILKTDLRFPELPDEAETIATFDAPVNVSDFYGQQLSTYFVPPETGLYTFVTSCNKECELWISLDRNPAHVRRIIRQKKTTLHNTFNEYPKDQSSVPVHLKADHCYYLQALMSASQGGDNLSVGVKYPSGRLEAPLENDSVYIQCPDSVDDHLKTKVNDTPETKTTSTTTRRHGNPRHKMLFPFHDLERTSGKAQNGDVYISNCFDNLPQCSEWATRGLCENPSMYGPDWMTVRSKCKRACGVCTPVVISL